MGRWVRATVSFMVLFGVLTSTWATCAEGAAAAPAQQMACCKNGHHQCPMNDSSSDCCRRSGPRVDEHATLVKATSLAAPVPVLVAWLSAPTPATTLVVRAVAIELSPPRISGAPPYIRFSVLLI